MPKFELHKVAFVNPSTETENVVLSTILEGAGGATRAFVEEEAESYVYEDNQDIKDSQTFTFTMAGKPNSDEAQLVSWADSGTKLTISGYAYGDALLIENAIINKLTDSNERRVWKITAQKAGVIGYQDGKLGTEFMMSKNLLNMYYFEEAPTSGIAAGWEKTGGTTSFGSGAQTFSTTGATVVYFQRDIYFPFEKELTFALTADSVTSSTGLYMGIQCFDENGSAIGTEETTAISSTGLKSVTRTLPSGTVRVRLRVKIAQDDSITFSNPSFRIGTSTEYISQ